MRPRLPCLSQVAPANTARLLGPFPTFGAGVVIGSAPGMSESFYWSRPPPVESLQRASLVQGGRVEMLSKATHQELVAAMMRSRSFLGVVLRGAVEGSTSALSRRSTVLFAEPCSP